jgi:chromosome segregation ATPase
MQEQELEATVSALRAELQERAASDARDRARLADAQAELKARSSRQAQLEAAQTELRAELSKLHELVDQDRSIRSEHVAELTLSLDQLAAERDQLMTQISALRAELAGARVAREAAESEALGWRSEVERLGGEFAAARDELAGRDGGLGEAEDLLAQARALRTRIQRQGVGVAAPAADGS